MKLLIEVNTKGKCLLNVDCKKEGVESAKSYLDTQGFSRSGLIEQLMNFDGYTKKQAEYAADKVGL